MAGQCEKAAVRRKTEMKEFAAAAEKAGEKKLEEITEVGRVEASFFHDHRTATYIDELHIEIGGLFELLVNAGEYFAVQGNGAFGAGPGDSHFVHAGALLIRDAPQLDVQTVRPN